jgi:hypothetical protein
MTSSKNLKNKIFEEINEDISSITPEQYRKIQREVQIEMAHTNEILHSIESKGAYYGR